MPGMPSNRLHTAWSRTCPMLRRLSVGLLASAIALAPLPTKAQDGTAEDLGDVMSVSLKDVVKPQVGFQGALQGAGTPNQAGIGGFLPLAVGDNSVWFLDALVMPTSATEMATAASSTPMLRVASPPPPLSLIHI